MTRVLRADPHRERPVGKASGTYQPVWLVPALSGKEMVAALESAGFWRIAARSAHEITLTRDPASVVRVPLAPVLDADQLRSVLEAARLSVTRLLEILERLP